MNKIKVFENEINYIKNQRIKDSLISFIEIIPNYFFEIPASSTGKYHPKYALGYGGLVRHTRAALKIANTLLSNNSFYNFSDDENDLIIFSLLIHDSFKSGEVEEKYTRFDHPLIVCNEILKNKKNMKLTDDEINLIIKMVETHMGEWNKDFNGNEVLRKPESEMEKFVHLCDFLASKKFLEVNLED